MKIAIIASGFFPVIDGVTVTLFHRIKTLSARQHQVLVFCPEYSALESVYPRWREYTGEILPGIRVINLPSVPFMDLDFERNISRSACPLLLKELQQFQPDIIHVDEPDRHFLSLFKYPGVTFARQNKIPCVGFFHTNFIEYIDDYFALPDFVITILQSISRFLIARNYNAYNATLTSSAETHRKLIKMGVRNAISDDLLGVDLDQFDSTLRNDRFFADTYQLPDLDRRLKLVFLGRLTPDKGWNFAIHAFSKFAQLHLVNRDNLVDNLAIVIAGDGPMRDQIADRFRELGLCTAFLGRIAPDAVPALLLNSDIHITTSTKETKGLTVLEAFAAGIPVIAPRAGGIVDSIQSGKTGLLFEPDNAEDFVQKLTELIYHPNLRQDMGIAAKAYVSQYTWENATDHLIRIWQQQIDRINSTHDRANQ